MCVEGSQDWKKPGVVGISTLISLGAAVPAIKYSRFVISEVYKVSVLEHKDSTYYAVYLYAGIVHHVMLMDPKTVFDRDDSDTVWIGDTEVSKYHRRFSQERYIEEGECDRDGKLDRARTPREDISSTYSDETGPYHRSTPLHIAGVRDYD